MKAAHTTLAELLQEVDPGELTRVCADLIRLNTTNPPGNERPAAEYVARYLSEAGFVADYLPLPGVDSGRASVVCRLAAGSGEGARVSALAFSGHLDVVPPGAQPWSHPPFAGEVSGGYVWGRGASDMKGGLAALLVAARIVARARRELRGDLLLVATAAEETHALGAIEVMRWSQLGPVGAFIIAEPTANMLGLAERGLLLLELTTHGKTAHGSTPHLGRNAINMMRRLLDEFDRLNIPYEPHPTLGSFTYSLNTIIGGAASNVVADHCEAVLDLRTVPGQDHAAIVAQIDRVIERLRAADPPFEAVVRMKFGAPAVETPPNSPAVQRFLAAAEAAGKPVASAMVRFTTEAAIFVPALAVPALIFGPGDPALAHQPDERVGISAMADAARVYIAAALELLTGAQTSPAG